MKKIRMTLLAQMIALIALVVFVSTMVSGFMFSRMVDEILENYMGQRAMVVAKLVAANEEIIAAMDSPNPPSIIQPLAEKFRNLSNASYVVIANTDSIRYSHPIPSYIGKPTATTNEPVLSEDQSIIFRGTGALGEAIKAKTPIHNKQGEIIGVSSVGFSLDEVTKLVSSYKTKVLMLSLSFLAVGIVGAIIIARRIKKLIFGLEPAEISFLFKEKEATIEHIRDATIAVDLNYHVKSMNKRARELFGNLHPTPIYDETIIHARLKDFIQEVIRTKEEQTKKKIIFGYNPYVVDLSPILERDIVKGVVLTIRSVSEIEQLVNEVSKIKTFSENIRAQNHEYLNKLNTIYGLLGLQQYDKAMELISGEVKERQDMIAFLMSSVKEPLIAACLLGKINRSKELKVSLEIDLESNLESIPEQIDPKVLVTILGNILDNAMEASKREHETGAIVKVSFTDLGEDIIFDVEDNGPGIPKEMETVIFNDGFTTKSEENHGIGLAIVKNSLSALSGNIFIDRSELGGARFTIVIPKR